MLQSSQFSNTVFNSVDSINYILLRSKIILGMTVLSTILTKNEWQRSLNVSVRQQSVTKKGYGTAHNKQQISIILHVPPSLGSGNLLTKFQTHLQYSVLTLIFQVSARICVRSILFGNLRCNVFSSTGQATSKCLRYVYYRISTPVVKCHADCRCQGFSTMNLLMQLNLLQFAFG
jgi:hypothetical protein